MKSSIKIKRIFAAMLISTSTIATMVAATPTTQIMTTYYKPHAANIGWTRTYKGSESGYFTNGAKIEAFSVATNGIPNIKVVGSAHVQDIGWMAEKDITSNNLNTNIFLGTTGRSKRLEAFKLRLTGKDASKYTIQYQAYVQGKGWTSIASNNAVCGTIGKGLALYGIKVQIVKKVTSTPQPKPQPVRNYNETINVPGPLRNIYGGIYTEYGSLSREVSEKNSITYGGQWVGKMDETLRKFSAGKFSEQDCKNIWLGKYIDGKYKVVNVRTTTAVVPWTADNVLPQFKAKGIWNFRSSSVVHFDKTLVYGSNIPNFRASRLVIDLQPIK